MPSSAVLLGGGFDPLTMAWALASLGYVAGLAISRLPLSAEGRGWGGYLISYSLVTAAFLAVVGAGQVLNSLAESVSRGVAGEAGMEWVSPDQLPEIYFSLGVGAFTIMGLIAAIGVGTALIPIVGPALANVLSVVSTLPSMALTGTTLISFLLAAFLTIFVTLAPLLVPVGVVLIAVPGGKLKGIGAWLLSMGVVMWAVGPLIPAIGLIGCQALGTPCSLDEVTGITVDEEGNITDSSGVNIFQGTAEGLIAWLTNPKNNLIMKMWNFAIGSMFGFTLLSAAAAGLSRGIGGVAASLGIG